MKIVLDTNVLVAGLLSPHGPPNRILEQLIAGRLRLCYDARILDEYRRVLARRRFGFDARAVADLLDGLEQSGHQVASSPLAISLPDPDDLQFLEVAVSAAAHHLVTGNLKHFPFEQFNGVKITNPATFLRILTEGQA